MIRHMHKASVEAANTITEVTRRSIMDYLSVGRHWSGTMQEDDFLVLLCYKGRS